LIKDKRAFFTLDQLVLWHLIFNSDTGLRLRRDLVLYCDYFFDFKDKVKRFGREIYASEDNSLCRYLP
jgi:hypothetical protein